MGHHHWIWIITRSRSSPVIITGSRSSLDLDHHHWISIITGHHHHGCYLMILLVTGSSTKLSLFHAGCRPSHHVGLHPALTSDLLVRKVCPVLTSDHVGTNPIIISKRPSTHIHQHDRNSNYYHLWNGSALTTTSIIGTQTTIICGRATTLTYEYVGTHPSVTLERLSVLD